MAHRLTARLCNPAWGGVLLPLEANSIFANLLVLAPVRTLARPGAVHHSQAPLALLEPASAAPVFVLARAACGRLPALLAVTLAVAGWRHTHTAEHHLPRGVQPHARHGGPDKVALLLGFLPRVQPQGLFHQLLGAVEVRLDLTLQSRSQSRRQLPHGRGHPFSGRMRVGSGRLEPLEVLPHVLCPDVAQVVAPRVQQLHPVVPELIGP
mmetsp:Transcript_29465/g.74096  ORF Transcript_29465/g.74096 Transcript_29465/m.74096 type:complete len:209 (+) Transcript_29465:52-678(+)